MMRIDWAPIYNTTSEVIPAGGVARVTGVTGGVVQVAKPNADHDEKVIVVGPAMVPGEGYGEGTFDPRAVAAYDPADGTPAVGETWGVGSGSWVLKLNKRGFRVVGGGGYGLVNVQRVGTSLSSPLTTKGDLWGYSTADARLPVGTDGHVLTADSGQTTGVKWAVAHPLTTKGDLFTRTSSAVARLPVGSAGQILTPDSAETTGLKWTSQAALGPAPGVPTSPAVATVGDQSVGVTWVAPSGSPPASTYGVWRSTNSNMSGAVLVTTTASTSYTVTGLTNGVLYYFAITAISAAGTGSAYSAVVSGTPQAAYLLDTFSGSSTVLALHLMDIGPGGVPNSAGWAELTSAWDTDGSGSARTDGSADPAYAVADAGYADCTVTATFTTSSDAGQGGMGVFVRATDANNGWLIDWANSDFQLFEVNGGAYTVRDNEASSGWATSTSYSVSVTLSGNSISATIGSQTLTYSSSFNNTADKHGLKTDNDAGQTFTIFQVSP